ncbi:MAG: HAS-barrel domain-containing protein, partial [Desulfurococcaceae archaeon]
MNTAKTKLLIRKSRQIVGAKGSLIFVRSLGNVMYGELVEIEINGETRIGQIVDISRDIAVIQVFGSTQGIAPGKSVVKFKGEKLSIGVSFDMVGRILNGLAIPIDKGP